jgi:hypothetical protein
MSDEQAARPRTRDQALWVGLFIIVALGTTLGLLFTLTDAALFRGRYIVTTNVPDAGGIRRGDPVQMRGVSIGRVMGFAIDKQGVTLRLEIEGVYPLPEDSTGIIMTAARMTIPPSRPNTPLQPQWSLKNPGMVPPTSPPIEPQPLMTPAAVEAALRVPKSIDAAPAMSVSGVKRSMPIAKRHAPRM